MVNKRNVLIGFFFLLFIFVVVFFLNLGVLFFVLLVLVCYLEVVNDNVVLDCILMVLFLVGKF